MNETPKELFVIHCTEQDLPVNITRNAVINYDHKDNTGKIQVTDIYSADEADVETTYGPLHVILGRDASDELEIALRIALHKLDLKHTFLNLDIIGCYQRLVLAETDEHRAIVDKAADDMYQSVGLRHDMLKSAALSLFDDVCRLQREMRESAQE